MAKVTQDIIKNIAPLAMTAAEVSYVIPAKTLSITFQVVGAFALGDVVMRTAASGASFTIFNGQSRSLDGRSLSGCTLYFVGAVGLSVEIQLLKGTMS